MKGYKALHSDMTGYNCFQYEVGKEYEIEGELEICRNGFHFCENIVDVFGYYKHRGSTIVCEVEASGKIEQQGTKFCAEKIKIIRVLDWEEIKSIIRSSNNGVHNSGDYNSGNCNSGNGNSGNYNSGNYNSGHRNAGVCNSGDCNSGSHNSGEYNHGSHNSGNCNIGLYNSGDCNSGNRNTGNYNGGNFNCGNFNDGDINCGDFNKGSHNTGNCNSGDRNSGFFNTNEPTVRLFNLDSGMTFDEFYALGINFYNLESCKEKIKSLPNYDAEIFYECTGIDWRNE